MSVNPKVSLAKLILTHDESIDTPLGITNANGEPRVYINASDVGVKFEEGRTQEKYLFEEMFYDSELEKENIEKEIEEVTVFTKIPKNSIRIPVAGGGTYSSDFACVVKRKNGEKTLNLIVETKDVNAERDLRVEEKQKIKHAESMFAHLDKGIDVKFETQLKGKVMSDIIRKVLQK